MIRKFRFDYDFENDSLFMYDPKRKTKASIELGDISIDYNSKKEVTAIELTNASTFFKNLNKEIRLTKTKLKNLIECKLEIIPKNNFLMVKLFFTLSSQEQISAPLYLPTVHEPSPASIA